MWSARKFGVSLTITPPKLSRLTALKTRSMSLVKTPTCSPNFRTRCLRLVDPGLDPVHFLLIDHWPNIDAFVERITHHHRLGCFYKAFREGLIDLLFAVNPLDRKT